MKSLIWIVSVVSAMLFGAMRSAPPVDITQTPALPQIIIESKMNVGVGEKTTIKLSANGIPAEGIASIQGKLTFDPLVLKVSDVVFASGFRVTAKNILSGEVRFAAALTVNDTPLRDGVLMEFAVEALGAPGATSPLSLVIEVLSDPAYNPIPHQAVDGLFKIEENRSPIADFSFTPASPDTLMLVFFTNNSSDPDGQIAKYEWDFGDGGKSTERHPVHRYRTAGTFTVSLTVTDDKGATAAISKTIAVTEGPLEVRVQAFPNPASTQVTFEYLLPGSATSGTLYLFDLKGERVLAPQDLPPEGFEFEWSLTDEAGNPVSNGPYFYVIVAVLQDGRTIRSNVQTIIVQR